MAGEQSPEHDERARKLNDFHDALANFTAAVELSESELAQVYSAEIEAMYEATLK